MGEVHWEIEEFVMNVRLDGFTAQFLHMHRGESLKAVPKYDVLNEHDWYEGVQLAQRLCAEHDLSIIARIGYAVGMRARVWAERDVKISAEREAYNFGLGWFYREATDSEDDERCAWHWSMRRLFLKNWQRGRQGHAYRFPPS